MKATHIQKNASDTHSFFLQKVLKAFEEIQELPQGTVESPLNFAATILSDGRTLIQTIDQDEVVSFDNGIYTVVIDSYWIYVNLSNQEEAKDNKIEEIDQTII